MASSTSSISINSSAPSTMSDDSNISSSFLGARTVSSITDESDNDRIVKKARISSEFYSSKFALSALDHPVEPLEAQPAGGPLLARSLSIITHTSSEDETENEVSHIPLPSTPSSAFPDSPLPSTPSSTSSSTTLVRDSSDIFSSLQPISNEQPSNISNELNKVRHTTGPIGKVSIDVLAIISSFLHPQEVAQLTQTNYSSHAHGFRLQTIRSKHLELDHPNPNVISGQLRHFFQFSPHVTSIEASSLTDEDLAQIAIKFPNVERIIVRDARAITNIEYPIKSFMGLRELKDLRLYQASNMTKEGWKSIEKCTKLELLVVTQNNNVFQAIQYFPVSLTILDLTNCIQTQIDPELHLERLTNLKTLVLSKTEDFMSTPSSLSGDLDLEELLKLHSKLECLYLDYSHYDDEQFSQIFAHFKQLKNVSVHNCGNFEDSSLNSLPSTVEILDMAYCTEVGSPALATKLGSQKWNRLFLAGCHVGRSCLEALLTSSKDSLKLLDIEDNAQTLSPDDLTLLDGFTQLERPERDLRDS